MLEPPLDVRGRVRVDLGQPASIQRAQVQQLEVQERQAPRWRGAAATAVGGDHVVFAAREHTRDVGLRRVAEQAEHRAFGHGRVGVGQPQHVECALGQHHARPGGHPRRPDVAEDASGWLDEQARGLEVVVQPLAPVRRPVAAERRARGCECTVLGHQALIDGLGCSAARSVVARARQDRVGHAWCTCVDLRRAFERVWLWRTALDALHDSDFDAPRLSRDALKAESQAQRVLVDEKDARLYRHSVHPPVEPED